MEQMTEVKHFLPKYFGAYLSNSDIATNGWNGYMKDWHVCLGTNCARTDDFEDLNCATPIEDVDMENAFDDLGPGEPGCELDDYCENGLFEPYCEVEEVFEGSAKVTIEWPEVDASDLYTSYPDASEPLA